MGRLMTMLVLVGCAGQPEPLPTSQLAPSGWLQVTATAMVPGADTTLTATLVPAGAEVTFVLGGDATSPLCPAVFAPTCLDLRGPEFLSRTVVADSAGVASWTFRVPPTAPPGTGVGVQAGLELLGNTWLSPVVSTSVEDADADPDGDGLPTSVEISLGTDPFEADTDNDRSDDLAELFAGTDPTDADSDDDYLPDGGEARFGTDPLDADSDDDDLGDGWEVLLGTDPLHPDSDGDGLSDGEEYFGLGTNPVVGDTDGDGCADGVDDQPTTPGPDLDGDAVVDACDPCPEHAPDDADADGVCGESARALVPLHDATTALEPEWVVDRGDAIITSFSDRGRDRHAREDQFQAYDHYLSQYWEYRTARFRIVDYVAHGGDRIEVSMVSEWRLSIAEFRAWYLGLNTVATYSGNYAPGLLEQGPGTFDDDHLQISNAGTQYRYSFTMTNAFDRGVSIPLAVGQFMEFEASQFLAGAPGSRQNYYGTTSLYAVGVGGLLPWKAVGTFEDPTSEREISRPIDTAGWLGGRTTLPYQYSDEPDNHFMQMATNLASHHGQPFVEGRRVHHTDMNDGSHDESPANGIFGELTGLAGPRYIHPSCDGCHTRNGRAAVAEVGEPLEHWVVRVGDAAGEPDPQRGRVLQPIGGEGAVRIASWVESNGLRMPQYSFDGGEPAAFSARIAPPLVGMGLLEAIDEADVLSWADANDADGDGISGRIQRVRDPLTGDWRLGRFGYRAGTSSVRHQVAAALNTDMGVTTSVLPDPDCGAAQVDCGDSGTELADEHLDDLVLYVSLLGVRARRDLDDPVALLGEGVFHDIGCADCHRADYTTSAYHPLAELRSQEIHPYTDLLLHDLGPAMADSLGEGDASGAEWRTAPLWGLGLGPCVTGGVVGPNQQQVCDPDASYLHDGRARTVDEAIRWHGGEGAGSRAAYSALSAADRDALLRFLGTL